MAKKKGKAPSRRIQKAREYIDLARAQLDSASYDLAQGNERDQNVSDLLAAIEAHLRIHEDELGYAWNECLSPEDV